MKSLARISHKFLEKITARLTECASFPRNGEKCGLVRLGWVLVIHSGLFASLPTYFSYSPQQKEELQFLSSNQVMAKKDLIKWDDAGRNWLIEKKIPYYQTVRFYAYLYAGQRDAAFLSYNAHGDFQGSLDPVSREVFLLFFPGFSLPSDMESDAYSEKLAALVFPHLQRRFYRENDLSFRFRLKGRGGYSEKIPSEIAKVHSWIPWILKPAFAFTCPPPPPMHHDVWKSEIQKIKEAQKNMTEQDYKAIFFWAGLSGPLSGDWRHIANEYMWAHNTPLKKVFAVRAVLAMSLYDTSIAYQTAKHNYSVIRPSKRDPSVETVLLNPLHPSYPSGHSTLSKMTAVILSYYFPEAASQWEAMADEAGMSRIWAGIHYPIDHEAGQELGEEIGEHISILLQELDLGNAKAPAIENS